jgi:hypothetical protein
MTRRSCALLFVAMNMAPGCREHLERPDVGKPMSFEVTLRAGVTGSAEQPLAFEGAKAVQLDIAAIGTDGQPLAWTGDVHLDVHPVGRWVAGSPRWITIVDGRVEGVEIALELLHGKVHLWAEDIGADQEIGSYATGLSPTVFVANPTIRNLQETDNHRTNPLEGDFVQLDLEGRDVIVTAVTNDGFYVTDKTDIAWGSVFVFTHSRPGNLRPHDRIVQLAGTSEEFFGFTELAFPSWKVDGESEPFEPVHLAPELIEDDLAMEQYESGLVEVRDVTVCPPGDDFARFGQWAVLVDPGGNCQTRSGTVVVSSTFTVEWFDPHEHVGQTLQHVIGNLRYHSGPGWIIRPRDDADLTLDAV